MGYILSIINLNYIKMKPLFYTIFFAILAGSVQCADIPAARVVVADSKKLPSM